MLTSFQNKVTKQNGVVVSLYC